MIEIYENYEGGFHKTVEFGQWCVGLIHYADNLRTRKLEELQAHDETDEAFILVTGKACLHIGVEWETIPMEKEKVYNVPKGCWHTISLEPGACVAVVENNNTTNANTRFYRDEMAGGAR